MIRLSWLLAGLKFPLPSIVVVAGFGADRKVIDALAADAERDGVSYVGELDLGGPGLGRLVDRLPKGAVAAGT